MMSLAFFPPVASPVTIDLVVLLPPRLAAQPSTPSSGAHRLPTGRPHAPPLVLGVARRRPFGFHELGIEVLEVLVVKVKAALESIMRYASVTLEQLTSLGQDLIKVMRPRLDQPGHLGDLVVAQFDGHGPLPFSNPAPPTERAQPPRESSGPAASSDPRPLRLPGCGH